MVDELVSELAGMGGESVPGELTTRRPYGATDASDYSSQVA